MKCRDVARRLPLFAGEDLSPAEMAIVRGHLQRCVECDALAREGANDRRWLVEGGGASMEADIDPVLLTRLQVGVLDRLPEPDHSTRWSARFRRIFGPWDGPRRALLGGTAIAGAVLVALLHANVPMTDDFTVAREEPAPARRALPEPAVVVPAEPAVVPAIQDQDRGNRDWRVHWTSELHEDGASAADRRAAVARRRPISIASGDPSVRIIWLAQNEQPEGPL